jgi:hypothetical protein
MTGLYQLLNNPERLLARAKAKAPDPIALRRAVAKLGAGSSDRMIEQTAELQMRVIELARAGKVTDLSRRDLREGCMVFLQPPTPPGRTPDVGELMIGEVDRLKRRAAFFSLINAYLDAFDTNDPEVAALGHRLEGLSGRWPWRATDAWPEKSKTFAIFDVSKAPSRIAKAVLASSESARHVLGSAGLDTDGRRLGGLAEAAFHMACRSVGELRGLPALPLQLRLVEWAETGPGRIAYPAAWPAFAGSLFLPWRLTEPPPEHKRLIIDTALDYAGDPRVKEARWRPVQQADADAYQTVMRWLTKASVEQFFDIVSETMVDRPDMWAERRKFWTAYLKANLISEAWVVFGADGARRADQASRRLENKGLSMFGRLASGGGRTSEHAALVMRIGDLTVVEWSHNGKWNVWKRGDRNAPTLFRQNDRGRPDYQPQELMNAPTNGSHTSQWRWTVADIIRRETGLRP